MGQLQLKLVEKNWYRYMKIIIVYEKQKKNKYYNLERKLQFLDKILTKNW